MLKCEIDDARMFLHVIKERRDPLGVIREAISNARDARASQVNILIKTRDRNTLDIEVHDNGYGIKKNEFRYFFGLGFRNKESPFYIGNKGLGTKLYFNSERIIVTTKGSDGHTFEAGLERPMEELEAGRVPNFIVEEGSNYELPFEKGTSIRVQGFEASAQSPALSWENLVNYIKWYTAAGSCSELFNVENTHINVDLTRIGNEERHYFINSGHELPGAEAPVEDDYDNFAKPFDRFSFELENDEGEQLGTLKVIGSIVGPRGHLVTDRRIKKQYKGVFLAKDYIVIRSVNEEVFGGTGEWQNMHIIANCQELNLAMGRDDFIDTGSSSIYAEVISALREFINSIKRGDRFRYRGRTIEVNNNYAGAIYTKLRVLGGQDQKKEAANLRELDLIAITSMGKTELSNDGGPVFAPMNTTSVLLVFQALVSNHRLLRLAGGREANVRYRVLGYASECVIVQKNVSGKWSIPLFYRYALSDRDIISGKKDDVDGIIVWESDSKIEIKNTGMDVLILRENISVRG